MLTNPNTLGLFESHVEKLAEVVHAAGGLVYLDGANMNALLGVAKPGHMGVDVMHFNLHKTFSTPHGGGGPGSGPVAVRNALAPFLPVPVIRARGRPLPARRRVPALDRPGARVLRQRRHLAARARLHPHARRGGPRRGHARARR